MIISLSSAEFGLREVKVNNGVFNCLHCSYWKHPGDQVVSAVDFESQGP